MRNTQTQREALLAFALTLTGAVADRPFEDDFDTTVTRHGAGGKWFGLFMRVSRARLGLTGEGAVDVVNLKLDPEDGYAAREMYPTVLPAYHMNKRHWVSVVLDGSVPQDFCELLVEKSFCASRPVRAERKRERSH